jgi:hypothetical protein
MKIEFDGWIPPPPAPLERIHKYSPNSTLASVTIVATSVSGIQYFKRNDNEGYDGGIG